MTSVPAPLCTCDRLWQGFKLEFHFSPNPFFSNSVLSKSYDIPNMLEDSEPTLNGVEG